MAQGKFSNPRPYREEEREIEQAYRKLTGKEPAPQPQPQPEEPIFDKKQFEQEFRQMTGEIPVVEPPAPDPISEEQQIEQAFRQVTGQKPAPQKQRPPVNPGVSSFDYIPEGSEFLQEEPQEPAQPDLIDKLMAFYEKNKKAVLVGVCAAALLMIVAVISVFVSSASDPYDGRILDNVLIADINVGGMTKNEAISAVKQATDNTYTVQDMVIDLAGTEIRLSPKDTKAELDVKEAVNAAYEYGRTGTQSERDKVYAASKTEEHIIGLLPYLNLDTDYIREFLTTYAEDSGSTLTQATYGLEGEEPELSAEKFNENAPCQTLVITMGTPGVGFDANTVYNQVLDAYSLRLFLVTVEDVESVKDPDPVDLEAIYEEFYIEPVNASIDMKNYKTIPGSYGYGFDLEAAQKLIDNAEFGEEVRIPMEYIEPDILDDDSFFQDTLGEYQTRTTGSDARTTNLRLACEAINGTILNPGETFSFNDTVGQRTSAKGYKSAPEDTGLESSLGGGVSQVSSTLYYAAMLSDLTIVSRTNLERMPSYIDYGMDADVSLKLSNSLGYPVKIEAEISGSYVKIRILGTDERDYYVTMDYTIANTYQPETEYEDFEYHNAEGYLDGDVIQEGITGYLIKTYKIKYNNKTGAQITKDFVTNSTYNAVNKIVARVEQPVETTEPTEETRPQRPTKPAEATTPSTEATTPPSSEATEPSTEAATEPSTEATAAATEAQESTEQSSLTGEENTAA